MADNLAKVFNVSQLSGGTHGELGSPGTKNILAMRCTKFRRHELLEKILESREDLNLLYVDTVEGQVLDTYNFLMRSRKVNLIADNIKIYSESKITLGTEARIYSLFQMLIAEGSLNPLQKLSTYLPELPNSFKLKRINDASSCGTRDSTKPLDGTGNLSVEDRINGHANTYSIPLYLDDEPVSSETMDDFVSRLAEIIGIYMKDRVVDLDRFVNVSNLYIDDDLLEPFRKWVNKSYRSVDYIVSSIKAGSLLILNNMKKSFDMKCPSNFDSFYDYIIPYINESVQLCGLSDEVYHPQHVRRWLTVLLGRTEVVLMEKMPELRILTSIGDCDLYSDREPVYSPAFARARHKNKEKTLPPFNIYKYMQKKGVVHEDTTINSKCTEIYVKLIKSVLESMGIKTISKLRHHLGTGRDYLTNYIKRLRLEDSFTLDALLESMINLSTNHKGVKLLETLNIEKRLEDVGRPTVKQLLDYIKLENLYPVVIYKFDKSALEQLYNDILKVIDPDNPLRTSDIILLSSGDSESKREEIIGNISNYRVVLTDIIVPMGSHYIFLDHKYPWGELEASLSNLNILNFAIGADVITFSTQLAKGTSAIALNLIRPMYFNNTINTPSNIKGKGTLSEFMKISRDLYEDTYQFNIVSNKNRVQDLHAELLKLGIDPVHIKHTNRNLKRTFKELQQSNVQIAHAYYNRSVVIQYLLRNFGENSHVLGIDRKHYKFVEQVPLYSITSPKRSIMRKLNELYQVSDCHPILLYDPIDHSYILTHQNFIRDFVHIKNASSMGSCKSNGEGLRDMTVFGGSPRVDATKGIYDRELFENAVPNIISVNDFINIACNFYGDDTINGAAMSPSHSVDLSSNSFKLPVTTEKSEDCLIPSSPGVHLEGSRGKVGPRENVAQGGNITFDHISLSNDITGTSDLKLFIPYILIGTSVLTIRSVPISEFIPESLVCKCKGLKKSYEMHVSKMEGYVNGRENVPQMIDEYIKLSSSIRKGTMEDYITHDHLVNRIWGYDTHPPNSAIPPPIDT